MDIPSLIDQGKKPVGPTNFL